MVDLLDGPPTQRSPKWCLDKAELLTFMEFCITECVSEFSGIDAIDLLNP